MELIKNELLILKTALNSFNSTEINNTINILRNYFKINEIGAAIENIAKNVLIGGYDEAVEQIDSLLEYFSIKINRTE